MPRTTDFDLLTLLPLPAERRHRPWYEQGRRPGYRLATMTPEQVEAHRADRRKLLEGWQTRTDPDALFPFGAFEELKRQEQETRDRLVALAAELQGTGSPAPDASAPGILAELRDRYAATWRLYRRLHREARAAIRYLRTAPPMTVPGLRWVFAEDDLRQVPEQILPPAGSAEWDGYQSA